MTVTFCSILLLFLRQKGFILHSRGTSSLLNRVRLL